MSKRLQLATLLSCLVVASCGGGSDTAPTPSAPAPVPAPPAPPPPAPAYVVRNLLPSTVDPAAVTSFDTSADFHVVIPPVAGVTAANRLFVFLPGTSGVPNQYELILKAGARRGFHTIGLDYPNPTAVGVLCAASSDPNCFWHVRNEIIFGGTHLSPDVSVTPANSIVTRLTEAVAYLNRTYPGEGWGQFLLAGGTLDWSKVVASGTRKAVVTPA